MIDRGNFESNKEFLEPFIEELKNLKVLEIGCGNGSMVGYLKSLGVDILGIDMNEKYLKNAGNRFGKEDFKFMKAENLLFEDNSFDVVLSFDLLEHIPDTRKHLEEVKRVLKHNGKYLLQTPNRYTSLTFSILRDKSFSKWKEYHPSLQTKKSLKRNFDNAGFNVEFIDVDTYTEYFRQKLPKILRGINPKSLGIVTNFYIKADVVK